MSDLVRIQVLLEKKQRTMLGEIAEQEGKSLSEVVRAFLDAQLVSSRVLCGSVLRERTYTQMERAAQELFLDYKEGTG